jgi:hypothetical protein
MTKRTYSDDVPALRRLQGAILYPHDVQAGAVTDEDGTERTQYSYVTLRVPDHGQQIEDAAAFALENYAALRKGMYADVPEQLDMRYHGTWDAHVAAVKAAFPKPEA